MNLQQHMSTAMQPEQVLKQPIRQGAAWNAAFLLPSRMGYEDWLAYHFNLFIAPDKEPQPEGYVDMPPSRPLEA